MNSGFLWLWGFCFSCGLALRYIPKIYRAVQAWRDRVTHSEPQYFRNLMQACQRNRADEAYSHLLEWLRLWRPGLSVPEFAGESQDPELAVRIDELGRTIFADGGKPAAWKGAGLGLALKRARAKKAASDAGRSSLPQMNPVR